MLLVTDVEWFVTLVTLITGQQKLICQGVVIAIITLAAQAQKIVLVV
jgi:hypothetical protein|tara:strand:+ start:130 stop:270 length:141 start_codon:yes stop_codon:yes gene_type:complete